MPGTPRIPRPEGYVRTTHTGLAGASAECMDCAWELEARNALGSAARHADTYGHTVHVKQTNTVIYNKKTEAAG